ncbi:Hypothetical protein BJL86_0028 [Dietzia timorensis]|uniref:DUF4352 domain-containing protein n=1 Tax=Dietzia timorensis TaxID=499555 RepID=A0A173LJV5_9ACTN|nr:Hypothetical protein BJL86_0028 [Dietzia timorensis]
MTTFQSRPPGMPPMQPVPPRPAKQRNVLGIIALVCAVVGFVFSCIPGALIVGWVLLPIAFVLGLVGLFLSGKTKGTSIAAVIISIVGTVVAAAVFAFVVADAFDDAFNGSGDVSVSGQGNENVMNALDSGVGEAGDSKELGSRENPAAIGQTLSNDDWDVTVNSFNPNASAEIAAENPFNEPPEPGFQYAIANVTFTYKGEGSEHVSSYPVAFVAEDGNVTRDFDRSVVTPDMLMGEVYAGGSATGNVALHIQEGKPGVLRIELGYFGDEVFVAVP